MATTSEQNPFPNTGTGPSSSGSSSSSTGSASQGGASGSTLGSSIATSIDNTLNGDAVNRVARSAHDVVDRVAERAIPAVERLRSGLLDAREAVKVRADNLGVMQDQWLSECRSSVREKPLTAVAIGVVAGMVLSRLLSR